MGQYIDKDAVLAEIEKLKGKVNDHDAYSNGWQHALRTAEININSLEVKEVDLEKEAERFVQTKEFAECEGSPVMVLAKHFFELGMSVSNKAQKGE